MVRARGRYQIICFSTTMSIIQKYYISDGQESWIVDLQAACSLTFPIMARWKMVTTNISCY
jgi:hypothetical protein